MGRRKDDAVAKAGLRRRLGRLAVPSGFVGAKLVEGANGATVLHTMLEMSPSDMARLQIKAATETALSVAGRNGAKVDPRVVEIKAQAKR